MSQSGTAEQESLRKNAGDVLEQHRETLAAWAAWLRLQQRNEASVKDHREKVKPFLRFIAARGVAFNEIEARTLADYQAHLFECVSPKTGKRLACNSQINRLTTLKNFLRFLHKSGRSACDHGAVITLPKQPKLLPPVLLKPDEVRRLLDAPDLHNPLGFRDRVILETFYATGLRLSELLSLAVDDLDFEQALVRVRLAKCDRPRLVPMGETCAHWLRRYLADVRPVLARGGDGARLFLNRFAQPLDKNGWHKKLDELVKLARIRRAFTTHGFRHMLATSMLERGADTRHVQEMLGHEKLSTTQRYLHVARAELKKVHARTHPREAAAKAYGHV